MAINRLFKFSLTCWFYRCVTSNIKSNRSQMSTAILDRTLSVEDLAQLCNTKSSTVIDILHRINNSNQSLQHNDVPLKVAERVAVELVRSSYFNESINIPPLLKPRPPIVTVMGHVDHGKTTLLDTLRNTSVATGEAGGITQHIGAFSVPMATGRTITFLDTPGHAVFSSMRSRGVTVTDVIVLVIAANDGVMPQTIECIEMAHEAEVPLVVAINKCDKYPQNITNVKHQLLQYGVQLEEFGGDVQCVEMSALTGSGLDTLEEAVLVQADLKELSADPTGLIQGAILETKTAKGLGSVATVLVMDGTLRKGCVLVSGNVWGHVRAMYNDKGKLVKEATPSSPVLTAGWNELPQVGEECFGVKDRTQAQRVLQLYTALYRRHHEIEEREKIQEKVRKEETQRKRTVIRNKWGRIKRIIEPKKKQLPSDHPLMASLVIKSDVAGSLEAIEELLYSCQPKQIKVDIALSGVGNITEEDINTAHAFGGVILAFNLSVNKAINKLAAEKGVIILTHNVIYKLFDLLKEWLQSRLPTVMKEEIIGEAIVLKVFKLRGTNAKTVGGCRVKKGRLTKDAVYQLWRNNELIYEGKLIGMKREKDDVLSALKETECGLSFNVDPDWEEGDTVICLEKKEVPQDIDWELGF